MNEKCRGDELRNSSPDCVQEKDPVNMWNRLIENIDQENQINDDKGVF